MILFFLLLLLIFFVFVIVIIIDMDCFILHFFVIDSVSFNITVTVPLFLHHLWDTCAINKYCLKKVAEKINKSAIHAVLDNTPVTFLLPFRLQWDRTLWMELWSSHNFHNTYYENHDTKKDETHAAFLFFRRFFQGAYYYLDDPPKAPPVLMHDWENDTGGDGAYGPIDVHDFAKVRTFYICLL